MRAKKIVNQSSDFPVRRTGSHRHKKALVVSHLQQHQLNRCGDCGSAGSIGTRQLLCSDVRGIDQLRGRKYVDRYTTVSLSCQRSETCENQNNKYCCQYQSINQSINIFGVAQVGLIKSL